ncbi:hypothetical protein BXT84_09195 [Sulfobacillus thermotolerans]|uniref:Aminotransferase n=1 Tax=Sulfobacillus thermotolerans TaxID=338644 RepID=A0ABM6RS03_9FIRM|nr:hypothetical protein BXT84_09195 [Sulfobacillus thermotolerans]
MHGGDWASLEPGPYPMLDLSSSISPYGPGPKARALWPTLVNRIDRYPDWKAREATQITAQHLHIAKSHLMLTAGGVEAIDLVLQVFRPTQVFVKIPAFSEYQERAEIHGMTVESISRIEDITNRSGLLFLANPANPTGEVLRAEQLLPYVKWAQRQGSLLVVDEAFLEFLPDWRNITLSQHAERDSHLIVIGSLTKFYGLAGLRVGYLVGASDYIQAVRRYALPWHVSLVAQAMAQAALQDQEYFSQTREDLQQERERLSHLLRQWGTVREGAEANFVLFSPRMPLDPVIAALRARAILVRDARDFEGLDKEYVRIAVKTPQDSNRLMEALDEIFQKEGTAPWT